MSRIKKLLLLVIVLAVLVGCYMLASKKTETTVVNEESGTYELTAKTADDISAIAWTADDVSYSFTRTDGVWYKTDNAEYPVAQDEVESLVSSLLDIKGNRKLENVTDISMYGLSEPAFTVTVTWSDGSTTVYQMGDEAPFGDSYYLKLDDQDTTVYTIADSLSDVFDADEEDFVQQESVPSIADVDRITVGTAFDASLKAESSTINASQLWYAADGRALDGVDDLVDDFGSIKWASLAAAVATQDQLTEWKLDDENAVAVTCCSGEESATILFGTTDSSGNYYARLPGSSMVYTVSSGTVKDLLSATPDSLLSLALIETDYEDVQEAVITAGNLTYTITAKAEAEETTEETAEGTESTETDTEDDADETLWSQVTAVTATEHLKEAASGETVLTISVTTKSGISAEFTFAEYSADNYTVTDGERTMLVDAAKIDKLIRTIKSMK